MWDYRCTRCLYINNFIQDVQDVCTFMILISDINIVCFIMSVRMTVTPSPVASSPSAAAVQSTSAIIADFIDEMGESHPAEVF